MRKLWSFDAHRGGPLESRNNSTSRRPWSSRGGGKRALPGPTIVHRCPAPGAANGARRATTRSAGIARRDHRASAVLERRATSAMKETPSSTFPSGMAGEPRSQLCVASK
eukprot:CAMPEP_0179075060 /NCGR_PEP_ID=MMETSP0796-20121207/33401_1 /TAXON_ID=73915 /ORGANISM="Pyrodinium bahamense, Strain pbaha01" /LENGTH=109 /DNA_ID=CAMNT_0020772291 /DNA_START=729 /DNA_END=1055 /DNA_ORIENTATION=+